MKLGLGTAAIGRPTYINIRNQDPKPFELNTFKSDGVELLEEAAKLGITYFDTAPGYGIAEKIITSWLSKTNISNLEIASKWGYKYVANFNPKAEVHEVKEHSLNMLNMQWEYTKSLLPQLTTLQIHSATFETGVLENQKVLDRLYELKSENNIHIGLTTTGDNQIEVIKEAVDIHVNGNQLFDVFQSTYNILDQSIDKVKPLLKDKRLVVKEGLANGRLLHFANYKNYQQLYVALLWLANKYEVGTDAIALRFCIDSIDPFVVLSGASNTHQLVNNLKVNSFKLTDDEVVSLKLFGTSPETYWQERKALKWN